MIIGAAYLAFRCIFYYEVHLLIIINKIDLVIVLTLHKRVDQSHDFQMTKLIFFFNSKGLDILIYSNCLYRIRNVFVCAAVSSNMYSFKLFTYVRT